MLVFVLLCITLCPLQFCNHLGGEERAGCFAFVVFWISGDCIGHVALPHGVVGLSAVCVVVIPDHTHLLFILNKQGLLSVCQI